MSTAPDRRRVSLSDYVTAEQYAASKHEFYQGEIFAMAGASPRHNRIATNIVALLHRILEGGPCEVFGSDQRIWIEGADLSTYPDASVICGGVQVDDVDHYAATNPRVIVEVLSKSTENYDRGPKFELYQHLGSFAEYVVVYQTEPRIIHYTRQDDGTWNYKLLIGEQETLRLHSLEGELPLASIYRNVAFGPETDDTPEVPRPR
jgi:Uma2 family endonuclease